VHEVTVVHGKGKIVWSGPEIIVMNHHFEQEEVYAAHSVQCLA